MHTIVADLYNNRRPVPSVVYDVLALVGSFVAGGEEGYQSWSKPFP